LGFKEDPTMRKFMTIACLLSVVMPAPAFADFWIDWPNGRSSYVTDDAFFVGLVVVVIALVALSGLFSSSSGGGTSGSSLSATDQAQQYEDEAVQYRAMSRKLDAETDLAESFIKAKRTRAELDDVEEFLRDDKRRRRR
jgi:hypothetical protein